MADIAPTINRGIDPDDGSVIKVTWNDLATGNNVGVQVAFHQHADRCVEARGTFNGAIITIQGSNGGTVWHTLTKPDGNQVIFNNANGVAQIVESPLYVRPNVTTVANNMALTVDLVMRRALTSRDK